MQEQIMLKFGSQLFDFTETHFPQLSEQSKSLSQVVITAFSVPNTIRPNLCAFAKTRMPTIIQRTTVRICPCLSKT
jgi:hypothetical protein